VTHLAVLLGGRHLADLTRTVRTREPRLVYRDDALSEGGTPLSLSLPLADHEHTGPAVERYLRGLAPESEGALAAIAREHRVDVTDAMDVLSAVGLDCSTLPAVASTRPSGCRSTRRPG
jgi:HipA-like protein